MMPNVKEGSIVEYKYTIESPFISVMPDWSFQQEIPVNHSELTTKIPEYFTFNPNFRGYYAPVTTKSNKTKSNTFTTAQRSEGMVANTKFNAEKLEYMEYITTYVLKDLPGLRGEVFVSNVDNYAAGVEHELNMVRYPQQPVKTYANSWEDVAKTIYDYDDFGAELKKTGYYEDEIKNLIATLKTPEEKAGAIFGFVKANMNWNEGYGYSCSNGVKKAYKDKAGNVAEINLMLTSMLRYAGLDANPVLVSTRSHKVALFPSKNAYNYVITAVKLGNRQVLLDATSKVAMPDVIPVRAMNWQGRLIRDNGTSESIELVPQKLSREVVTLSVKMDASGTFSGKARDQYHDNNAYIFRDNYTAMSKESYLEKLEKKFKGVEIGEYTVANSTDFSKPVMEEYDFTYNNAVDIIGDKIYFNPMLFFTQTENPFKAEKREYPIDFVYPHEDKYMVNITLPEGYSIESIPESLAVSMEQNIGSFRYTLQQQGNNLQLMVISNINFALIPQTYYETLKNYFQKIVEKQTEKIVLKKNL